MTNSTAANQASTATPVPRKTAGQVPVTFDTQRSNAFQRELDRLDRNDKDKSGSRSEREQDGSRRLSKEPKDDRGQRDFGDEQLHNEELQSLLSASGFAAARAGNIAATAQASPELPPEHLARIAAAIQELLVKGGDVQYQLQMPAGNAMLSGAVFGHDAAGRVTIQLIASGTLPPAAIQQLQQRLAERLKDRNLRLGKIGVTEVEPSAVPTQTVPSRPKPSR